MSLALFALIAWIIMSVFVIVPKWLTVTESFFLYFIIGILSVALFTILDVNLNWVPTTRDLEKSLALDLCRFIIIPLLIMIAVGLFHSPLRAILRWLIGVVILALLLLDDWAMQRFGLITFRQWSYLYSFFMYVAFMVVMSLLARWFTRLD